MVAEVEQVGLVAGLCVERNNSCLEGSAVVQLQRHAVVPLTGELLLSSLIEPVGPLFESERDHRVLGMEALRIGDSEIVVPLNRIQLHVRERILHPVREVFSISLHFLERVLINIVRRDVTSPDQHVGLDIFVYEIAHQLYRLEGQVAPVLAVGAGLSARVRRHAPLLLAANYIVFRALSIRPHLVVQVVVGICQMHNFDGFSRSRVGLNFLVKVVDEVVVLYYIGFVGKDSFCKALRSVNGVEVGVADGHDLLAEEVGYQVEAFEIGPGIRKLVLHTSADLARNHFGDAESINSTYEYVYDA